MGIAHWDDVEPRDLRRGPMQLERIDLGHAAGSKEIGVARLKLDPGGRSSPVHVELDEEEIFYVLAGTGLSWQSGKTYEVRAGDTIVHRVAEEDHTLIAGPDGLDVLAFGERTNATASYLTRAGVLRMDATVKVAEDRHPWDLEADAGDLELPEPSLRPSNIVNVADVAGDVWKRLGGAAGSERTGLNWGSSANEAEGPVHCHSEEEEIYVVLEGAGTLVLVPTPQAARGGTTEEELPIRAGHVISRPPGTRIAHGLRANEDGMTFLAYGTRKPNDIRYYPRSNKIFFAGVGVIARLEDLDYDDGEPERS
jgi:uncharacterized cupin superfamily protein